MRLQSIAMGKAAEKTTHHAMTSADIIRELRGPLPDDDPEFQKFLASGGARTRSARDQEAAEAVLRDLRALPEGTKLTNEELFAFIQRLPPMHDGFSSADVIRELRGPLPEDDPDFPPDDRR
jgi:hypothetical protein